MPMPRRPSPTWWTSARLWLLAWVASLGGLLFGYNATTLGLVATTAADDWSLDLTSQYALSGAFFLGAILGGMLMGRFSDVLSRKDVITAAAACYAFFGFACAISGRFEELLLARFLLGSIVGVTSLAIPLYIAEISRPRNRGALVSLNQLSITLGILLAFGFENGWLTTPTLSQLYTVSGILAVIVSLGAILLPESPAWLVKQGDGEQAADVLANVLGMNASSEIAEINAGLADTDRHGLVQLLQPSNRRLLGIGVLLFSVQQLSGINFILQKAGDGSLFGATPPGWNLVIAIGIVNLLGTVVFIALVDRIGRRPLLLGGMAALALCLMGLIAEAGGTLAPDAVRPVLMIGYVFCFAISLGPIPWLFVAEIYPLAIRGISMSIPITVNWVLNAFMVFAALSVRSSSDTLTVYWISLAATVAGIPLCWRLVPETRRLRFSQIRRLWHRLGTSDEGYEIAATLATSVVTIGGIFFGYNLTVIAGALLQIRSVFSLTPLTSGLVVSSVLVGAILGSYLGGHLAAVFGRRSILLSTTVLLIVGSAVSGLSESVPILVLGRLVTGVATGVTASIVPLYISEISPAAIRGRLNGIQHLAVCIGVLAAYGANTALMPNPEGWRAMLYLGSVPALMMGIGTLFLPESPRWLLSKSRFSTARLMLARLCVADPDREIARITTAAQQPTGQVKAMGLFSSTVRPPLLIGLALVFFQECTGIIIVTYYSPTIFQACGVQDPTTASLLTTIGVGVFGLLMTLLSFLVVDRIGRRKLFLLGILGILASSLGFAFIFSGPAIVSASARYLVLACFILFVTSFSLSIGAVCGMVISEIYPQAVRDRAIGFVIAFQLLCGMVASFVFPTLVEAVGLATVFSINAAITALGIPFWYAFMPETRGKSLEEIERHWLAGKRPSALR
ncbi:sugar transporter, MFS superfamily [Cyanobium sp. PCC 7001]|uniref:sugar porter family MFS transporter n=1 Tax=Cyanobium sp. PCC 7001 TaxID=180281 RepID=UPI0001804AEA|nr:sugar porter family MFS transporter [Cyanobium sp. PCC 7001]EDY39250.1 sugar transporter, MFS superfamily [Cyanobium sp. PCC 7001]